MNDRPVSKRLRYEILRRDGYTCRYCGAKAIETEVTVDHVVPTTLGGSNEPGNLVAACRDCNAGKSSVSPDADTVEGVTADAIRWADAMKRAAAIQQAKVLEENKAICEIDDVWSAWRTEHGAGVMLSRPEMWQNSLRTFIQNGLNVEIMSDLIVVAMTRGVLHDETWRYFCGCCWREIEARQEIARALLASEDSA